MNTISFISATLALLLAPGPTNTLMDLAGVQGGMRRVLRLILAELAGYLAVILPLVWLGQGVLTQAPWAFRQDDVRSDRRRYRTGPPRAEPRSAAQASAAIRDWWRKSRKAKSTIRR